ncbi:hypothetical protein AB0O07_07015 [Streptomyces sp. NPDC093085]|uniref:hypothetical protein n=1 Tax=Streptomyces sp. NPDC093085 TaxID=3155068 RepID=UPI00342D392B
MSDRVAGLAVRRSRAVLMVAALALALLSVMGTGTHANAKGQPESAPTAEAIQSFSFELSTGGPEHPAEFGLNDAAKTFTFLRGTYHSFAVDDWIAGKGQHPFWALARYYDSAGNVVGTYRFTNPVVTKVESGASGGTRVTAKYQSLEFS